MNKDVKCEKCNNAMRQIGPFARAMQEGQSAQKWNGVFDFECINQQCENKGKIIKIKK